MVCGTLDVAFSPEGIDSAAESADIAKQQLHYGHGTYILGAHSVLSPAHGIHDGCDPVRFAGGSVSLINFLQHVFRGSGDG